MYQGITNQDFDDPYEHPPEPPTSPEHAVVYATALLTQAERALTDARQHQITRNANAVAAAITAATYSHHVADSWILSASWLIADNTNHSPLAKTCDQLHQQAQQCAEEIERQTSSVADIMNDGNCEEQTIRWYLSRMQPVHSLAAFRYIQAMLSADHAQDNTWNEDYRSACIETMEQLADQPAMAPMEDEEARAVQTRPDGFTDAKRETQEAYEEATRRTLEFCQQAIRSYNENIPMVISPTMKNFPGICKAAAETPVSTLQVYPGLFCSRQTIVDLMTETFKGMTDLPVEVVTPQHLPSADEGYVAYVLYIHQGQKYVQAVADPYPKGFPADQAVEHMEAAMEYLEQQESAYDETHPELQWCGFRELIQARMNAAMMELHDVSQDDLLGVIDAAKRLELPHGARIALIEAATNWEPTIAQLILKGTGHAASKMATRRQASEIIKAARQAGLDEYKLADIAEYLGYEDTTLGIAKPKVSRRALKQIEQAGIAAGLPRDSIESMLYELES